MKLRKKSRKSYVNGLVHFIAKNADGLSRQMNLDIGIWKSESLNRKIMKVDPNMVKYIKNEHGFRR